MSDISTSKSLESPAIIDDDNIYDYVDLYFEDKEQLPPNLRDLPIGQWDVSRVTNMTELFRRRSEFNEPIGNWDVSNVTNMYSMFNGASKFNQDISRWNVSNVTNMQLMFHRAEAFDQPIGEWNISRNPNMNMRSMFQNADSFRHPIDRWNLPRESMLVIFGTEISLRKYIQRLTANTKYAETFEEYNRMCTTAEKSQADCTGDRCSVCLDDFIENNVLARPPVMFHKTTSRSGNEMWVHPIHIQDLVRITRASPYIPQTQHGNLIIKCPQCKQDMIIYPEKFNDLTREVLGGRNRKISRKKYTRRSKSALNIRKRKRSVKHSKKNNKNKK